MARAELQSERHRSGEPGPPGVSRGWEWAAQLVVGLTILVHIVLAVLAPHVMPRWVPMTSGNAVAALLLIVALLSNGTAAARATGLGLVALLTLGFHVAAVWRFFPLLFNPPSDLVVFVTLTVIATLALPVALAVSERNVFALGGLGLVYAHQALLIRRTADTARGLLPVLPAATTVLALAVALVLKTMYDRRVVRGLLARQRELTRALARKSSRLLARERLASTATVYAGLAHEIQNPLHVILGTVELLRETDDARGEADEISAIGRAARAIDATINRLREIATEGHRYVISIDAAGAVDRCLEELGLDGERCNRISRPTLIRCHDEDFRIICGNLVRNALEAGSPRGEISIEASRGSQQVTFTVSDRGRGFHEADIVRLREPYASSHEESHEGLGLHLVEQIVGLYGGSLVITAREPRGTSVSFTLPGDG